MFTSRKILIVEDYGDLFDFLGEAMALLGWESIFAANSQEALDMLEHDSPSTILLNVRAPVTNGINLLVSIKAHPTHAKIPVLAAIGRRGGLTRECLLRSAVTMSFRRHSCLPNWKCVLARLCRWSDEN